MNEHEELAYLIGIVTEASKWERSEGDGRDAIRMEIEHRINVLLGTESDTAGDDGRIYTTSTDKISRQRKYDELHVLALCGDGLRHKVPREDCVQVPCRQSRTGYKWQYNGNLYSAPEQTNEEAVVEDAASSV